jgi:cell wall-associated NlpC family hydrolase
MSLNAYIGIPYRLMDCYALVREVGEAVYGKTYPSVTDYVLNPQLTVDAERLNWRWEKVEEPFAGCVVLLGDRHVGLYIGDDQVIHAHRRMGSVIQSLAELSDFYTIEGFYKWND